MAFMESSKILLGLDISTSCVGVCLLNLEKEKLDDIVDLSHINFKGCDTLWQKADKVVETIVDLKKNHNLVSFYVEEALMAFRPGMSSAQTISTLIKFNGICCYNIRRELGFDPCFVSVNSARKLAGIKIQKTSVVNKSQKEQVFEWMAQHDLSTVAWPKKQRSDKLADWSRDATDAYVIARAGSILYKQDKS